MDNKSKEMYAVAAAYTQIENLEGLRLCLDEETTVENAVATIKAASERHNQVIKSVQVTQKSDFPNDPFRGYSLLKEAFGHQEGFKELVLFQTDFLRDFIKQETSITSAIPWSAVGDHQTHERFRYYSETIGLGYGRVKDHIFMSFIISNIENSQLSEADLDEVVAETENYLKKMGSIFQSQKTQMETAETEEGSLSPASEAASPLALNPIPEHGEGFTPRRASFRISKS